MKVSDLIRAAGGLKQSADVQTADLTHYVWKDDKQVTGQQEQIALAGVLTLVSTANPGLNSAVLKITALNNAVLNDPVLNNGDVLSIRQVPGWADLGASIIVRGEVVHPGNYGIRPGERLSSVLTRAGAASVQGLIRTVQCWCGLRFKCWNRDRMASWFGDSGNSRRI